MMVRAALVGYVVCGVLSFILNSAALFTDDAYNGDGTPLYHKCMNDKAQAIGGAAFLSMAWPLGDVIVYYTTGGYAYGIRWKCPISQKDSEG